MNSTTSSGPSGGSPPHRLGRRHALMDALMLVATFAWASNIIAAKEAVAGFGPVALAQLRVAGTATGFGLLYLFWRSRPRLNLGRRDWMFLALAAASGVTLNQLLFLGGLARISVAHTGLIVALGPVLVLALSCLVRLEALTTRKWLGMAISLAGVAMLTLDRAGSGRGGDWHGDLIQLGGTTFFAIYTVLLKEVADRLDAVTLNMLAFGIGGVLMLPLGAWSLGRVHWGALSSQAWWGLAYLIVAGSLVPYLIYAFALTELTAARVAAFQYLQPLIAIALGIWLLAETLRLKVVAGGVMILLGVYITERERGGG